MAPRRHSTHRTGLLAAAGLLLVFAGVVGYFIVRGKGGGRNAGPPPAPSPQAHTSDVNPITDDTDLGFGKGWRIQLVDKQDPTRQAGEIRFATMDPLEGRRYAVTMPEFWVFLKDGRTAHIRADSGKLYLPDRQREPESGTIEGNGIARLFAARDDGSHIDPDSDPPVVTAHFTTLTFDTVVGELSTPDRVTVRSDQVEFEGRGVLAKFNEVHERLDLLEVRDEGMLVFKPRRGGADPPEPPTQADGPSTRAEGQPARRAGTAEKDNPVSPVATPKNPAPTPPAPARNPAPTKAAEPVETIYQIVFNDEATVTQLTRSVAADKLTVWARLFDNRLPEGAVARIRTAAARIGGPIHAGAPAPMLAPAALPAMAAVGAQPSAEEPDDVTFRWKGKCVVRPLGAAPPELADNHVWLRFTAEQSGLVRLKDEKTGATGRCATLDYGATSRDLSLTGPGPASVALAVPGSGEFSGVRCEVNLGTGVARVPGPGVVTGSARQRTDGERPSIAWSQQADAVLRVADGAVTGALDRALFTGDVRAIDPRPDGKGGQLSGDFLRAEFKPGPQEPTSLSALYVEGSASAKSDRSGTLQADTLQVAFSPAPPGRATRDPDPTALTARGNTRAASSDATLAAATLDATLARDNKGDVVVETAVATGSVRVTRNDGVSAQADEVRAEPPLERAVLLGERVRVARDATSVTGTQVSLDGKARSVEVFGAGTFEHSRAARAAGQAPEFSATWSSGMKFEDAAGRLECHGDAVATSAPDPFTRDRLEAEHVHAEIEPLRPGQSGLADPSGKAPERRLLRARAMGSILDRQGGRVAIAESSRSAADGDGAQKIVQGFRVEGARLVLDAEKGTLDVPCAGRLFTVDNRPESSDASAGAPPGNASPRGATLFDWDGSMHMERPDAGSPGSGWMEMLQNVRLTHRRLGADQVTNLVCERLRATLRQKESQPGKGVASELVSALAHGAVYLASGAADAKPARELIADKVDYDAIAGKAEASAAEGNLVTMFDARTATPASAQSLTWDLVNDRVELHRPRPLTTPR